MSSAAENTPTLRPQDVGAVIGNVPFGQLLCSMARAIAEAQTELDKSAMRMAEFMSGSAVLRDPESWLPIDVNGQAPRRSEAGVYYKSDDKADKTRFEPHMLDTRVFFGRDLQGNPRRYSMMELGFTPTFYQFVDTILEIKIAITLTKTLESDVKNKGDVTESSSRSGSSSSSSSSSYGGYYYGSRYGAGWWGDRSSRASSSYSSVQSKTTPVDATYTAKYGYSIEASSLVRTKLVPVPVPAVFEERIREQIQIEREREAEAEANANANAIEGGSQS